MEFIDQNQVAVIEAKTHTLTKTIDFGDVTLSDVMFIPNRPFAYLSRRNLNPVVIDAVTHAPAGSINGLRSATHMTMSLDGRFAYAMHSNGVRDLVVVSTENHEVVARVPLADWGTAVAVSPDGAIIYAVPERWDAERRRRWLPRPSAWSLPAHTLRPRAGWHCAAQ